MQTLSALPRDVELSRRPSPSSVPIVEPEPGLYLQVWSAENAPSREDIFRLEDGRIVSISSCRTVSGERLEYGVSILSQPASLFRYNGLDKVNRAPTGFCGSIFWHPSGAWELYPKERLLLGWHANRSGERVLLNHSLKANARLAALHLVAASDRLNRQEHYIQAGKGLKVGGWRVAALGNKPECYGSQRPAPASLPVRPGRSQHFMATKGDGGPEDTVRIIVSSEPFYSNGLALRAKSVASHWTRDGMEASAKVVEFCIGRCRHA